MIEPRDIMRCEGMPGFIYDTPTDEWRSLGAIQHDVRCGYHTVCRKCRDESAIFIEGKEREKKHWFRVVNIDRYVIRLNGHKAVIFLGTCHKCGTVHWGGY